MSRSEELTLRFCQEATPAVSLLTVVWPAGDPAGADYPTVIATWLGQWDDALGGALTRQQQCDGFAWALDSHLWLETQDRLPFPTLLLVGATPRSEADWPGWTVIGERLGRLASARRGDSLGVVVDRIFAPGLGELATGLFTGLGATSPLRELVICGSIAWTDADREVVRAALRSCST